ncbi:MAG: energy-dependent translational throttle protein EttA [Pseudomonadota bacterium]|nr:energy-dependent translational throttle protein EttA [Pseudomonadota bacterium]
MNSNDYIFVMQDLSKAYPGGKKIFNNVTLAFLRGAKIGVLGVNGAGKSTVMKIMAGLDKEFSGEARMAEGSTVGYLPQEPTLDPSKDVFENVLEGMEKTQILLENFEKVSAKFSEKLTDSEMDSLIEEQAKLQEQIDVVDGWELERTIEIAMDALRCPPGNASVSNLSGGECRRVALCRLLLQKPDLLLLDEPTNHLDTESVAWLECFLDDYPGTVISVTHDRYFLDNVAGWILEFDRGKAIPFQGNYSSWLEQKEKRLAQSERQEAGRQKTLARELEWVRSSPRARQAKNKARIAAYDKLLSQSNDLTPAGAQIIIPPGNRLGDLVIEAKGVKKAFENRLLIENLSFKLQPGGIIGVIGPNGAGKTTLFNMITGGELPNSGELRIGESVKLGYVDQSRQSLNDESTVWEEISEGETEIYLGKRRVQSRAYVGSFNFRGPDQQKKVGQLSGGERNRVHLAKMLKSGANVLLLDEPTNDLDVDTLRALEDALCEFPGCVVVISHDRWFLDRISTHILAFEEQNTVVYLEGNYHDYELDRKKRFGEEYEESQRIKYKPLTKN